MKRIVILALTLTMIVMAGVGTASAANSLKQGILGLNIETESDLMVFGKYFIENNMAVLAGFGLGIKGGDADGTDIALAGGVRKYLKTDDFAPFVGGLFAHSSTQDGDVKGLSLLGQFGAEYFLGKQFSIEGSVSFGFTSVEEKSEQTTVTVIGPVTTERTMKDTTFGTNRAGFSLNFYF